VAPRVIGIGVLLVACAQDSAPLPTRPPMPDGWIVVTSDERDVRLALPPELQPTFTSGMVLAQEPMTRDGVIELEVSALPPWALPDQPGVGESLVDWLVRQSLVPRDEGLARVGGTTAGTVALPTGRGAEIRVTASPGTPDESLAIAYAIPTSTGVAAMRIVGRPERIQERAEDLRLVLLLAEFEPPHPASTLALPSPS
jgi:hypothetical protein